MPGFSAINDPPVQSAKTSHLAPASQSPNDSPKPGSNARAQIANTAATFRRTRSGEKSRTILASTEMDLAVEKQVEYVVVRILDRRCSADEIVSYLVEWEDSAAWVKEIFVGADGLSYIRREGKDWQIHSSSPLDRSADSNEVGCTVAWANTWSHLKDLDQALILVSAFECEREQQVQRELKDALLSHKGTGMEAVSAAVLGPTTPNCRREGKRRLKRLLRDFHGPQLVARLNIDYNDSLRAWVRKFGGRMNANRSRLMLLRIIRPLVFRELWCEYERRIDFSAEYRGNACLVFSTGYMQTVPCKKCEDGKGPFPECVVDDDTGTGACANCIYSRDDGKECHFHKSRE